MVVPHGHPRIVVRIDADFPHECHGNSARADVDSAQADTDFRAGGRRSSAQIQVEDGGNQKANFVRNNRLKDQETCRKDRSNYHYRNRSGHEI